MKSWISCAAVLCGALAVTTAWAAIINTSLNLPGVDGAGNLSQELGAVVPIKVNVNIKTGAFRATGNGQVRNLSGAKQTFNNAPVSIPNVVVSSSKYTVAKTGKCSVSALGTATAP